MVAGVAVIILGGLLAGGGWLRERLHLTTGATAHLLKRFLSVASATDRSALAGAVALTATAWSIDTLLYLLAGRALGVELRPAQALVILAVASLGTIIPSAPGYVGTFELAASSAAAAVGIAAAPALALAILVHALTLVPLALGGGISALMLGVNLRRAAADPTGATGTHRA